MQWPCVVKVTQQGRKRFYREELTDIDRQIMYEQIVLREKSRPMTAKLADKVRAIAIQKYVQPARRSGANEFSIPVRELLKDLEQADFPRNYTPLVCNSIRTKRFQRENDLEITRIDGPKSQTGTRVVVHYRILGRDQNPADESSETRSPSEPAQERAARLVAGLRGLLRQEIRKQGGSEAFVRWVRSDDEDAA